MQKVTKSLEHCIEMLCRGGCRQVTRYIALLREERPVPGLEGLSPGERAQVLRELESVMAAYGNRCDGVGDVPGTD